MKDHLAQFNSACVCIFLLDKAPKEQTWQLTRHSFQPLLLPFHRTPGDTHHITFSTGVDCGVTDGNKVGFFNDGSNLGIKDDRDHDGEDGVVFDKHVQSGHTPPNRAGFPYPTSTSSSTPRYLSVEGSGLS